MKVTEAFYECKEAKKIRPYIGIYANSGAREIFQFDHVPTEKDGLPYIAVIGPFQTMQGARYMAEFGRANPHCQHVNDAEGLAKKYKPYKPLLELRPNGDPYGSGFNAIEYSTKENELNGIGVYRGDLGDQPRSFWRHYAKRNEYRLREYT